MTRDERSLEEHEEELVDVSDGSSSRSSSSDDENEEVDPIQEEIEDQAVEEKNVIEQSVSSDTESESQQERDNVDLIPRSERPTIDSVSPELRQIRPSTSTSISTIQLTGSLTSVQPPSLHGLDVSINSETVSSVETVSLKGELQLSKKLPTQEEVNMRQMDLTLGDTVDVGSNLFELEDPLYNWTGGTAYGLGHPAVVLHVSPENRAGQSLAFLQRKLRDEYIQRRGGEPQAKEVQLVANKPKIPSLSNTIVTFDLTDEEWELNSGTQPIRIERNGEDALEYIAETVRTTYAGELGYLIVNLPNQRSDPFSDDIVKQIQQRLLTDTEQATTPWDSDHTDNKSLPVICCEIRDTDAIHTRIEQYWFGTSREDEGSLTVESYEQQFERELHELDWIGTVLTEQHEGESEEHYHLKAHIATGLAKLMYENSSAKSLTAFTTESLLDETPPIRSESTQSKSKQSSVVDLEIDWQPSLKSFVPIPDGASPSVVAFEVETGRGEAAASFRKIWHTIDRLEASDLDVVYVVIPPRLLLHRNSQRQHLQKLIDVWNLKLEDNEISGPQAVLCTPKFDLNGDCTGLQQAEKLAKEVYNE